MRVPVKAILLFSALLLISLSRPSTVVRSAAVGPSGKIAFASNRSGSYQIYLMDADGSNVIPLTTDPDGKTSSAIPIWSRDGKHLIYMTSSSDNPTVGRLTIANSDGSNPILLADNITILNPYNYSDWSFDAKSILYSVQKRDSGGLAYFEFHLAKLDGTGEISVNPGGEPDYGNVKFLPDGSILAFERTPTEYQVVRLDSQGQNPQPTDYAVPHDILSLSPKGDQFAVADLDNFAFYSLSTGEVQDIAAIPGLRTVGSIDWSPDGKSLIIQGDQGPSPSSPDQTQLVYPLPIGTYVVSADGKQIQQLITDPSGYGNGYSWSPDSQFIVYDQKVDGHSQIFVSRPDGSDKVQLTQDNDNSQPEWQPIV